MSLKDSRSVLTMLVLVPSFMPASVCSALAAGPMPRSSNASPKRDHLELNIKNELKTQTRAPPRNTQKNFFTS